MGICSSDDKQPTQQDSMAQSHGADEIEGPLINLQMTAPALCTFQIKGEDTVGSLLAMVAREMQSEPGNLQLKLSKSSGASNFVTEARLIWALEVVRSRAFSGIYEGKEC